MSADADRSGAIEAEVVKKKIKPAKQQKPSGKVVDKPNPQQIAKERAAAQKAETQKNHKRLHRFVVFCCFLLSALWGFSPLRRTEF